jgi:hypothetical protein
MNLAICTIQRNRSPWLEEWITFHSLVGFSKFYIFLHKCDDDSEGLLKSISRKFDISSFIVDPAMNLPQLEAYKYCYQSFSNLHDWIAFIDGDEFLFAPNSISIEPELSKFRSPSIGAIGVYWAYFGSSGHKSEPSGLITENYRYRAPDDFWENGHFKSIVKGGQAAEFSVLENSHFFKTSGNTFDTKLRPLTSGFMDHLPCYEGLRINHYGTQSYEFFRDFKQNSGCPDAGADYVRPDSWFIERDRNDIYDSSLEHLIPLLRKSLSGR